MILFISNKKIRVLSSDMSAMLKEFIPKDEITNTSIASNNILISLNTGILLYFDFKN